MGHHEANGKTDEWYTPKYVFDALECKFNMDVACPEDHDAIHTPTKYCISHNSLEQEWDGFVWMNPPFGGRNGLIPWLDKIHRHGNGIALTPDRTSAPWWQNTARKADAHLQVNGKIKFISGDDSNNKQPSNGTTLFAFGEQGVQALLNAQKNGLGIVFQRIQSHQLTLL